MEATIAAIKMIKGLDSARNRRETGLFKIEGTKAVTDTVGSFAAEGVFATAEWIAAHPEFTQHPVTQVPAKTLERMSGMKTAPDVIAVCRLPLHSDIDIAAEASKNLVIALDTVQDPGNLGTIMRTADWYGITLIVASRETADAFSPKVVQATMGAISRVRVVYCDLAPTLSYLRSRGVEIYGTFLSGDNIYESELSSTGVIVTGNEGNGISPAVEKEVTRRITIPSWPADRPTSESLNAAVATAITVSQFRSRTFKITR